MEFEITQQDSSDELFASQEVIPTGSYHSRKPRGIEVITQTETQVVDAECEPKWPRILQPDVLVRSAINGDEFLSKFRTLILEQKFDEISKFGEFYHSIREKLSVSDDLIFIDHKLVIPDRLQSIVLEALHDGHPGYTGMRAAGQVVWWPGMNTQITQLAETCDLCVEAGKC